jgi:hypothetical protein
MEQTKFTETSAYKIQSLGNYPEESKQQFRDFSTFLLCRFQVRVPKT